MASKMEEGLVLSGYQKKLKTMRKKFFALYKETSNNAARLEYYDTERKFNQRSEPKRVIFLKNCFNINRRFDTKQKFVLALSSREGGFGIVFETESDLRNWLDQLLFLQRGNANISDQTYPPFEYVWQVMIQKKGMSEKVGIMGSYHCCLTSKSLTFMCIGPEKLPNGEDRLVKAEILLTTVRRCGHAPPQGIFYMELGRQSVLGSGELWMETEDAAIAKNMHDMILTAMSAKTESNMNLINVCQGRPEVNNEPGMRKRSSSANEASKPINVLQKRQIPIEIRNSISPHSNSYGRERCDSLPTRNRALSECSNQSYNATSNHAFRSNTISGFRPYSCQRHSNSPPLSTPIRCSESEESSISVDETDDNGTYNSYRFNPRTSKGIILEENVDDFIAADNKCNSVAAINENLANYIPMTPIKSTSEIVDANKLNQFKQNVLKDELNCTGSKTLLNVDEDLSYDFPEHSCENLGKDSDVDADSQCERPTRAYSIGSKIEHTKISKRLGNVSEVEKSSTPRVRAFSVGSRSKIPRCDLQRGVLCLKARREQDVNESNCNINEDLPACNEILGFNVATREKKSTSAPLLNLKSQINTDRMSDLMEIDFSKISTASIAQKPQQQPQQQLQPQPLIKTSQVPKTNIQSALRNNNKISSLIPPLNALKPTFTTNSTNTSDSGYLEMKPVGNAFAQSSIGDMDIQVDQIKPKVAVPTAVAVTEKRRNSLSQSGAIKFSSKIDNNADYIFQTNVESSNIKNNITKSKLSNNTKKDTSFNNIKSDEYISLENRNLENKIQNLVLDIKSTITKAGSNDERKLTHSISNEDYTQNANKTITESTETGEAGYKILQIKSDSSLISTRKLQGPCYKEKFERQHKNKPLENVIKNNGKVHIAKTTPETQTIITANAKPNIVSTKDLNTSSSRPSSVTSEHELHYASLDLPQCSGPPLSTANKNRKEVGCESPPVAIAAHASNSYAKIDFDHSDSSSSSSKICNL